MTDSPIDRRAYRRLLGANLARIRSTLTDYSQETIAAHLSLNADTYGSWERGQREPRAYDLMRLSLAFDVPAEWLLFPVDSLTELDRRVARVQRVASEAARLAEAAGSGPRADPSGDAPRNTHAEGTGSRSPR